MGFPELPQNPRIAVVGSGAVGSFYGGKLAQAGHEVHFLMRSDLEVVRQNGLRIQSGAGDFHLPEISCHETTSGIGPADLVLIALKATDNEALESLIPPLLKDDTILLTLQNGLGNEEFLAERFGAERVMGGLCFVCLNRIEPGVIHHIDHGRIEMGEFSGGRLPRTLAIRDAFEDAGVECKVRDNLGLAQWRKLVWNIPFNGLSILGGGIDVAQILADDDLRYLCHQLMEEIIRTAALLGHEIPASFAGANIDRTRSMGDYQPSSMIDFLEGREVEVEAIWGEPYLRGLKAGAEVGRLETVYHLIRRAVAAREGRK